MRGFMVRMGSRVTLIGHRRVVIKKDLFMTDKPVMLGGCPIFHSPLSMFRPTLPPYEAVSSQIAELFETGMLTTGRYLQEFEERLADHLQVKHAVATSSCTVGLVLACQALNLQGE